MTLFILMSIHSNNYLNMPAIKKFSNHQLDSGILYSRKRWKCYSSMAGCVPIDTQQ